MLLGENQLLKTHKQLFASMNIAVDKENHHTNFVKLSEEESMLFANKAMNQITDEELLADTFMYLSLFTNGNCVKPHYNHLIAKGIFYPCEIYMHADSIIADKLMRIIETNYARVNVNHILICLAWIGTAYVIDFLVTASNNKPVWTKGLYVPPVDYTDQAGWIIGPNNKKINLISHEIFPLVKTDQASVNNDIKTFVQHKDTCQWCSNKLTTVFKIHTTEFTTCLLCGCLCNFYMKLNDNGQSHWHPKNKQPEYPIENTEMDVIPENTLKVSNEKRLAPFSVSQFTYNRKSQLGGFPTWVQDAEHINCIDCDKKMQYVGQINMGEVNSYGEGYYYFHHCPDCNVTGSNFQQS